MKRLLFSLISLSMASSAAAAPAVVAAEADQNYQDGITWSAIPAMNSADDLAGMIGAPTFPDGNSEPMFGGSASDATWGNINFSTPGSTFDTGWSAQTGYQKFTSGELHGEWACQWAAAPRDVATPTDVGAPSPGASIYYDLQNGGTDTFDLFSTTIFGFGGFSSSLYMMSVDLLVTTDSPVTGASTWTPILTEAIPDANPFAALFSDGSLDPGDDITSVITSGIPGSTILGMHIADSANPGTTAIANGITGIRYDFYAWATDANRAIYLARTAPGCAMNTFITEINAEFAVAAGPSAADNWDLYE